MALATTITYPLSLHDALPIYPLFGLSLLWLWASLAGLPGTVGFAGRVLVGQAAFSAGDDLLGVAVIVAPALAAAPLLRLAIFLLDRKSTRLNSSHVKISYAVF